MTTDKLKLRRAEQLARVAGFRVTGAPAIKKPSKSREYPSLRGDEKRARRADLIASMTSDKGRVVNAWSAARRRNWNGKGKLWGGAKDIDWTAALNDLRGIGKLKAA